MPEARIASSRSCSAVWADRAWFHSLVSFFMVCFVRRVAIVGFV